MSQQDSDSDDSQKTIVVVVATPPKSIKEDSFHEPEITDDWGYKSVWNQTNQDMAFKLQCIYLVIALILLNLVSSLLNLVRERDNLYSLHEKFY